MANNSRILIAGLVIFFAFMILDVTALGITDGTFCGTLPYCEQGNTYSTNVILTNSPDKNNSFVVTVSGDIGNWITNISPAQFNLSAGETKSIRLTILVPVNASIGMHTGTITATGTQIIGGETVGYQEAAQGTLYADVKAATATTTTTSTTTTTTTPPPILINEFQPNPEGTDAGNEWVELYNNGTTEVNLTRWTLETLELSGLISSKGFKQFIFPTLTLTNTGDIIVLKYGNITVDRVVYGNVTGEISIVTAPGSGESAGRIPDGVSNWTIFTMPTPGAMNLVTTTSTSTTTTTTLPPTTTTSLSTTTTVPPDYSQGTWTTKSAMPTARSDLHAASTSGLLYVVGGNNGSGATNKVEAYNPVTDAWTTLASMPTAVYQGTIGVIDGKLYVVGGWDYPISGIPTRTLQIYNPATNTWSAGADMPILSGCSVAGAINRKLYILTACDGYSGYRKYLHVYDSDTDSWAQKTSPPNTHAYAGGGVIDGKFYIVGGFDESNNIAPLDVYDPATDTWVTKASMPTARQSLVSGVIDGKLYAVGGSNGTKALSTLEVYDPVTNTWTTKASMTTARNSLAADVIDGKLYAVGGSNGTKALSTLEVFSSVVTSTTLSPSTTTTITTSTTVTTSTSSTTTTMPLVCPVKGDEDCDGVVGDFELLHYIEKWGKGLVGDSDVLEAIDNWAKG